MTGSVCLVPAGAGTPPDFRFERYWPALQQPWYFGGVSSMHADDRGQLVVLDTARTNLLVLNAGDGRVLSGIYNLLGTTAPETIEGLSFSDVYGYPDDAVALTTEPFGSASIYDRQGQLVESFLVPGNPLLIDFAVGFGPAGRAFHVDRGLSLDAWGAVDTVYRNERGQPRVSASVDLSAFSPAFDGLVADHVRASRNRLAILVEHPMDATDQAILFLDPETLDSPQLVALPAGVTATCLDRAGSDGFFLCDGAAGAVLHLDEAGSITMVAAYPAELPDVVAVQQDAAGGWFFSDGQRILRTSATGETLGRYASDSLFAFEGARGAVMVSGDDLVVADDGLFSVYGANGAPKIRFSGSDQFLQLVRTGSDEFGLLTQASTFEFQVDRFDLTGASRGSQVFNLMARNSFTVANSQGSVVTDRLRVVGDGLGGVKFVGYAPVLFNPPQAQICVDDFLLDGSFIMGTCALLANQVSGTADEPLLRGVALGPSGHLYASVAYNPQFGEPTTIAVLDPAGALLGTHTGPGFGLALGGQLVAGTQANRFVIDTRLTTTTQVGIETLDLSGNQANIASRGIAASNISRSFDLAGLDESSVFVVDYGLNRVQRFDQVSTAQNSRAIVVAAGGPFPGNVLWPATQANANLAYRTLSFQGFGKDTIHYLSSDQDLDLDQNGQADDVDADATNADLMEAILGPGGQGLDGFAGDPAVDELVIYLVDHGGLDRFRMSASETLAAADLAGWIDTWQLAHPTATIRVIYDACQSGSFMTTLAGTNRTIITSASDQENAYFVSQGTLSFSNFFWTHVFNGLDLKNAFDLARQSTTDAFDQQHPLLDADGDGVTNEPVDDLDALTNVFIGNATDILASRPQIGSILVDPTTIVDGNSASVTALDVTDPDGIARVWAVLRPPGFNPESPDNPVSDLPAFDLFPTVDDDYSLGHDGFSEIGTYQITVHALDTLGNTAIPRVATVVVENPLKRRAVVVVGGQTGDATYAAFESNGVFAVSALTQQGYGPDGVDCTDSLCDDIKFYLDTGLPESDGAATLANVQFAIEQWGADENQDMLADVQDLTIYLVGEPEAGGLRLGGGQVLTPALLDSYLATAEALIPGRLTLVMDGDNAGGFVSQLSPAAQRITVASTAPGGAAAFFDGGSISFSRFFWGLTLNGASVNQAFRVGGQAVGFGPNAQVPGLDDTGNGIPNELFDGLVANQFSIGNGVLLAGDDPVIGSISPPGVIQGDSYELTVGAVTSTSAISAVNAVVFRPDGITQTVMLSDIGNGNYQATLTNLDFEDLSVDIVAFATDIDGDVSLPRSTQAVSDVISRLGFE